MSEMMNPIGQDSVSEQQHDAAMKERTPEQMEMDAQAAKETADRLSKHMKDKSEHANPAEQFNN